MSNRNSHTSSNNPRPIPTRFRRACTIAAFLCAAATARADNFSWLNTGASTTPGVTGSIFLRDNNVAAVDRYLATQTDRAVTIDANNSPATINGIYDKYKIDYTFVDYETPDAVVKTASLVNQIKASTATGPAFAANKAF